MKIFDRESGLRGEFNRNEFGEFKLFVNKIYKRDPGKHNVQVQKNGKSRDFNVWDKENFLKVWEMEI